MSPAFAEQAFRNFHPQSCIIVVTNYRHIFLKNYSPYPIDIWYAAKVSVSHRSIRLQTSATPTSCLLTQSFFIVVLSEHFHHIFLRNYSSQPLNIWYAVSGIDPIPPCMILGFCDPDFLFTVLVCYSPMNSKQATYMYTFLSWVFIIKVDNKKKGNQNSQKNKLRVYRVKNTGKF